MGLVVTMKPGQRVRIGPDAWVTYLGPSEGSARIKLGFDAPPEVSIRREEILPLAEHFNPVDQP